MKNIGLKLAVLVLGVLLLAAELMFVFTYVKQLLDAAAAAGAAFNIVEWIPVFVPFLVKAVFAAICILAAWRIMTDLMNISKAMPTRYEAQKTKSLIMAGIVLNVVQLFFVLRSPVIYLIIGVVIGFLMLIAEWKYNKKLLEATDEGEAE